MRQLLRRVRLETALFDVPQAVIYKTSPLSYNIGQVFIWLGTIRVKFFSLVNIILDRKSVEEILQYKVAEKARIELGKILNNKAHYQRIKTDYQEMKALLGSKGASKKTARYIYEFAKLQ